MALYGFGSSRKPIASPMTNLLWRSTNNQANNFSVDGAGTVCGTVGTFKLASNAQMTLTIFKLQKQLDATQTHLDQTRVSGPGKVRGRTSLARVACFGIRR